LYHDAELKKYAAKSEVNGLDAATRWKKGELERSSSSLPPSRNHIQPMKWCTRAKDMWNKLKKIYEERSWETRETLPRKFRNQKCEERERGNVHTHFEKLAHMREQLAATGKTLDKHDYVDLLLACVPSSH
jgi:hypothetical protein